MKISIIIFFFLALFLISPLQSYASNNNPVAEPQYWVRLKAEPVKTDGKLFMRLTTGTIAQKPNKEVYIAECIDTADDRVCTTGTEEGDMEIYQSLENLNKIKQLYGYVYNGILQGDGKTPQKNPVKTNGNGEIPTLWFDSQIQGDVVRKFYGVNIIKEDSVAQQINDLETLYSGDKGGQQQGMFKVLTPTPTPKQIKTEMGAAPQQAAPPPETCAERDSMCHCIEPVNNNSKIRSFLDSLIKIFLSNKVEARVIEDGEDWGPCDPYGRVFDAVSLEPIASARVTLLTEREGGKFSPVSPKETVNAMINPWTTKEDGKFTFMVLPGTYQLSVNHTDFVFPFDPQKLNPNYSKAYYEIYYGKDFSDQVIIDKGVEHRDIPVIPRGEPYRAPVKLLGYVAELNKERMIYEISGRTSHPLTIVEIMGRNVLTNQPTRTLRRVDADKWGFFNAAISTTELHNNEIIGTVKMTKVDLTQSSQSLRDKLFDFLFKKAFAESSLRIPSISSFPIHHLLNYLEGYAYDTKHNPLPSTRVSVYLIGSKKPYYTITTDEKGYFVITSQHLPQMNYGIQYTTQDKAIYTVSQSQFLTQNLKTITDKKINLNSYIKQSSPFVVSAQEREKFSAENNISPSVKNNNKANVLSRNNDAVVIVLTVLFTLLLGAIIGITWYIKQKK